MAAKQIIFSSYTTPTYIPYKQFKTLLSRFILMYKHLEKTPQHEQWQNAKILLLCPAHASTLNVVYLKANKTQFYVI